MMKQRTENTEQSRTEEREKERKEPKRRDFEGKWEVGIVCLDGEKVGFSFLE